LEDLHLKNNQLAAPPVVTELTKLWMLDLSDNKLKVAPVVTGLTKLMELNLNNNKLIAPPDMTGLTNLLRLYLDSNLCGDPTLLKTLRDMNSERDYSHKISLYAISKDVAGDTVKTEIPLD